MATEDTRTEAGRGTLYSRTDSPTSRKNVLMNARGRQKHVEAKKYFDRFGRGARETGVRKVVLLRFVFQAFSGLLKKAGSFKNRHKPQ